MLDLQKSNKMFSIEDQAIELAEKLADATDTPWKVDSVMQLIEMLYDDYLPTRLEWNCPITNTAESLFGALMTNLSGSTVTWRMYSRVRDDIKAHLEKLFPFKTWGYLFMRRVGSTIIIEETGDRRIDEWHVMTADGTVTPDSIASAIVDMVHERLDVNVVEQITWDMESLVRVVYQRAINKRV